MEGIQYKRQYDLVDLIFLSVITALAVHVIFIDTDHGGSGITVRFSVDSECEECSSRASAEADDSIEVVEPKPKTQTGKVR